MAFNRLISRFLTMAVATGALAGCAAGDRFAGRVSTYNSEAEKAQDQAILLNVLRAAKRRPLSFTELQNVTSSGTPSGSIGFNVPLAQNGGATASAFNPTLALSGGPTLSAGFINTQEFYQGMLKPVPISTIDLFIQRGIPPGLLFNLLFSRIIVKRIHDTSLDPSAQTFTAINDVGDDDRLRAFQTLVEVLLNRGLTTGSSSGDPTPFGPPLTDAELVGTDLVAKAAGAGLHVTEADWCDLDDLELQSLSRRRPFVLAPLKATLKAQCEAISKADAQSAAGKAVIGKARAAILAQLLAAGAPPSVYRLEKPDGGASFRFCIAGPRSLDGRMAVNPGVCGDEAPAAKPAQGKAAAHALILTKEKTGDHLCEALNHLARSGDALDCAGPDWAGDGLQLELEPRSTYSVIYYLGEIVRREALAGRAGDPGFEPPYVMVKIGDRLRAIPDGLCAAPGQSLSPATSYRCQALFYLRPGHARRRGYLSVRYDGEDYAVPDEGGGAKTSEVLDIVNELIALNHSSKDSPTSSLLTVVGVH